MEWMAAAILLGLAGSLHCVGMCGPLMLALPVNREVRASFLTGRLLNQAGRILVYGILGLVVGFAGEQLVTAGLQQWLAVLAGVFMLFFIAWPAGLGRFRRGPALLVGRLKMLFATFLQRRGHSALFLLGMLNGLLPCGLVYLALASSLALGDAASSAAFMVIFGLGTSPALLMVTGAARFIRARMRHSTFRMVQASLAVVACLVILRGANLGIPYLSPRVEVQTHQVDCCARPR